MKLPRIFATTVVIVALAGCTTDGGGTAGTASGIPMSRATEYAGGVPADDTLLTFTRTGGTTGRNDKLVMRTDGSYSIQTGTGTKNSKLTPDQLGALMTAFAAADFNQMPSGNSGGAGADGPTYTVTYGGRQVTAEAGAIPPALQPVISALSGFLDK